MQSVPRTVGTTVGGYTTGMVMAASPPTATVGAPRVLPATTVAPTTITSAPTMSASRVLPGTTGRIMSATTIASSPIAPPATYKAAAPPTTLGSAQGQSLSFIQATGSQGLRPPGSSLALPTGSQGLFQSASSLALPPATGSQGLRPPGSSLALQPQRPAAPAVSALATAKPAGEGRPGMRWIALESNSISQFGEIIVRATMEVGSAVLKRLQPREVCIQRGQTMLLQSGLVRMQIEPEGGWVTVHARNIGGPTLLATAPEDMQADNGPSIFDAVPQAAPDPILTLATWFKEDKCPEKVNLGIGAYRTEEGKPWPLPSVLKAQMMVAQDPNEDKEYVPIDGKAEHKKFVQQLIFSDDEIETGRLATTQAMSGTGSLSIIGQFLSSFMNCKTIHLPDPTWGNHHAIFKRAKLEVKKYTYYKPETRGFDFEGMLASLCRIPAGDAVLLHSVAQNPTGVDPTPEQWEEIVSVIAQLGVIPVLDNAYQGYASGSLEQDGFSQQLFEAKGLEYFVAQSFAKNFGLYGERIGYVHVRCATPDIAKAVLSQLKILIRQAYSSPPRHGAAVVYTILKNPDLKEQWLSELQFMAQRIFQMRDALRQTLEMLETPGTWNHITDQIGMFSYTGLNNAQVDRMVKEFHIYMTKDGRISVAGLNPGNVEYVAQCIDKVVREG